MATASSTLSFAPSVVDHAQKFFIDGEWVAPSTAATVDVINPSTEEPILALSLGAQADVDRAVEAARKAFWSFSTTTKEERIVLLERVIAAYEARMEDLATVVSLEMGAPVSLSQAFQVPLGLWHFQQALEALKTESFEERVGTSTVVYEPVGVCAMITPWNWPLNQISVKVAPALATGCTMVLKPSEIAPLNGLIVAEVMEAAGVPRGVFNLVNGDGPTVGAALASHPQVDMVSFTGSTRAGIEVARAAAPTVKRVTQELGGKSANIVLDDADLREALGRDCAGVYVNSGQSCNAGARILVPSDAMDEAIEVAREVAEATKVGDPRDPETSIGPVVSLAQYEKVQRLIQSAIDEGATLVVGGPGRPTDCEKGYFVRPTVFANVTPDMTIAKEEIFGPVLTLTAYRDEDDAVRIANETNYGLSGYVSSADHERAARVARRLRTGMVHVNGAPIAVDVPFGGYKQSGNGREFAGWGLREYLEAKTIYGDND